MITQDIEIILSKDEKPLISNNIPNKLFSLLDDTILNSKDKISEEAYGVYKKFVPMKQDAPEGMKNELFSALKSYIKEKINKDEFYDALLLIRFLIVKSNVTAQTYYDIADIFSKINKKSDAIDYIKFYEHQETNKPLKFLTMANFYNLNMQDYKTAIKYYEQYLKFDETKSVIYTILAGLYAKAYGQLSINDQINYFEKAYKLKPSDRLILHGLAFNYEKLGNKRKADKYYNELLKNNPTETDYYNYGGFLISCGDFKQGYKYLTHRFNIEDINLKYPIDCPKGERWDFKTDISQKTLLVHYEQGYGDTIMYCRFVPFLKAFAKKVIFVVQQDLYSLIKNSVKISKDIEIVPDNQDISTLDFDYHMALLDAPYILGITTDEIPYTKGYLSIDDSMVENYTKKYIKPSKNMKVGISCSGNIEANYNDRDIDFTRFKKILDIENIDFYLLSKSYGNLSGIIPLGNNFNDFEDSACAVKSMDLIISSDNVILNLAGALGAKTYGLFNKTPNFRWYKLDRENVGWYKSVIPLQVEQLDCWEPVLEKLYKILK